MSIDILEKFLSSHRANMKKKCECIFEGKKDTKTKILLKKVYTQLYITEGEFKEVNKEHEILKIDKAFSVQKSQEKTIHCNEIFNLQGENEENKVVLTKGIAGIGKTVSVQKFILDWAEGEANQSIDCIFLLPFREINLIKDEEYSLHELLQEFHPELERLSDTNLYKNLKLAFIFDGLDENRLPLDFRVGMVRSEQKKASVNALIKNLIEGNLLPSALVWITSRPAAANQIPSQHIKKSRSLYIMCHIPIFCWITATVLQEMLVQNGGEEIPTTLTEMYIHFLLVQMNIKNQKYDDKEERDLKKLLEMNREMILKLAKLAFKQLEKGKIMFYEDDLIECGIEEFLAALHVFDSYLNKNMNELQLFFKDFPPMDTQLDVLLKNAVDKAKETLAYMILMTGDILEELDPKKFNPSNSAYRRLIPAVSCFRKALLAGCELTEKCWETVASALGAENSVLTELDLSDNYRVEKGAKLLSNGLRSLHCKLEILRLNWCNLTEKSCSFLSSLLNTLRELDLSNNDLQDSGVKLISEALTNEHCKLQILRLSGCLVTEEGFSLLASALSSNSSSVLTDLDLSYNNPGDRGEKLLSELLNNPDCKLETLKMEPKSERFIKAGIKKYLPTEALQTFLSSHRAELKKKCECIFEGKNKKKIPLKEVYTQLYITEGEFKEVNKEHEILKIDKAFSVQKSQEKTIHCNEIFNLQGENEENKVVLTKGIAGIGKTVSVQKFILDWAEGEANQSIDCVFLLPFREINLIKDEEYSLHELLQEFHPELERLSDTNLYKNLKLAFIFDGLDENRLPLDFRDCMVRSEQKKASVNALIKNLIEGNLLPSALVWITSRPAAANQIPSQHVSLFTEVRGFTDKQKEEYFKKRITDVNLASKIISQIKKSRSLYIMCHIPIFCWITATVLQEMLVQNGGEEIPTTLTEMYIHFLLVQMNIKNQKYDDKEERDLKKLLEMNREMILKLAKLAFKQLEKGKIMFYEDDLIECGIEVSVDSEYTGMCAEIFKKESVLHEKKVYCFIHLSIQEFLAALHVFDSYLNKNMNELQLFFKDFPPMDTQLDVLLKNAVDKAKESENGHLDLFLRFLLGISLESNQKLLQGILTHTHLNKKSISKIIQFIRQKQNKAPDLSPETSINHFFCLMELKDSSLYNQIKKYLCTDNLPNRELSSSNCSALAYMILMTGDILEELDPKKFNPSNSAYRRLIPAVSCFRKALLAGCELTEKCWETVASALGAENSVLTELDLSDNYRVEKGAKLLSDGLRSLHCKLEILRLNWCNLTEKSCSFLSSLLNTLRELDLSNNDLQDSGVKLISEALTNEHCKLQILRLSGCLVTEEGFSLLASALSSNSSSVLTDLDLSYNNPGDRGEKLLSELLNNPDCKLETFKMEPKSERFIRAGIRKYACSPTFNPNTAHTRLCLSESNRKVSFTFQNQQYPDHPDRFELYQQVLCNEGLSCRCYWEVCLEDTSPEIGITYLGIRRHSEDLPVWDAHMKLGLNSISWALCSLSSERFFARHNSEDTDMDIPKSNRIGVYLDWPAGTLSFYNVSPDTHTLTHIHTFCTVFKEPVYPAFSVDSGSLTLCQLD
ncbi:hypothetical protein QTP86_030916 [Hemibagrus guttatus]|nr:hypothetical protein QTP86_030916 [Hemibagrus guttatus]